jgi:hypothetical protein
MVREIKKIYPNNFFNSNKRKLDNFILENFQPLLSLPYQPTVQPSPVQPSLQPLSSLLQTR